MSGIRLSRVGIGATEGFPVVRGPFAFTFATVGLAAGVTVYTPTIGDILLDAWISVLVAFDGTTPKADLGSGVAVNVGLFSGDAVIDLTVADAATYGTGLLTSTENGLAAASGNSSKRIVPSKFTSADPILVWASQNGQQGGTALDSAAGSAQVYIVTATPVAL